MVQIKKKALIVLLLLVLSCVVVLGLSNFFFGKSGFDITRFGLIKTELDGKERVVQQAYKEVYRTEEHQQPPTVKGRVKNQEILKLIKERLPGAENNFLFYFGEREKYALAVIGWEGKLKRIVFVKTNDKWNISMVLDRKDYRNESLFGHITKKHYDFPQELIPSIDPKY